MLERLPPALPRFHLPRFDKKAQQQQGTHKLDLGWLDYSNHPRLSWHTRAQEAGRDASMHGGSWGKRPNSRRALESRAALCALEGLGWRGMCLGGKRDLGRSDASLVIVAQALVQEVDGFR